MAPPVDLRDALEQIGQDVMEGTSPRRALSELLRRGTKDTKGADRLAAEVNRRRRELLNRNNLDGTLQEIKQLLDEAVLDHQLRGWDAEVGAKAGRVPLVLRDLAGEACPAGLGELDLAAGAVGHRHLRDALAREQINVTAVRTQSRNDLARMRFSFEVSDVAHLKRAFATVKNVSGVIRVARG